MRAFWRGFKNSINGIVCLSLGHFDVKMIEDVGEHEVVVGTFCVRCGRSVSL